MAWTLCKAELRCLARRLDGAFAASPLVVGGAALALAALPAVALWAGLRAAPSFRAAAAAQPFAVSVGLAAALAGSVVTLLAPGRRALGRQLEAAPLSRATVFAGLTALPLAIVLCAIGLPGVLLIAPAAGLRTPVVLAELIGALALGGAGAEAVLALARRSLRGVPAAAAVGLIALGGRGAAPLAVPLWAVAAALRPDELPERGTVRVVARSAFGCALVRYARRRELRRQALAALVLTGTGAFVLRVTGMPAAAGVLLAGSSALLGAAVVPLAAPGLDLRAQWLWRSSPSSPASIAGTGAAAALVCGASVAALGTGVALAADPVPPAKTAPLGIAGLLVLGAALLAGSLVPWRSERPVEQLGAYAAFAAVLTGVWIALARLAPFVGAERGARAAGLAAAAFACCVAASIVHSARRA